MSATNLRGRVWKFGDHVSGDDGIIEFSIVATGFGKAFDGPPVDPKVLEEQQKKLQEELQKRSEDMRKRLEQTGAQAGAPGAGAAAPRP